MVCGMLKKKRKENSFSDSRVFVVCDFIKQTFHKVELRIQRSRIYLEVFLKHPYKTSINPTASEYMLVMENLVDSKRVQEINCTKILRDTRESYSEVCSDSFF